MQETGTRKHYKIIVAYDGTLYSGWQVQKEGATVAGQLQNTFLKVFNHPITLIGASRTDAGVHALGQVALFKTYLTIPVRHLLRAWNNRLPSDIVIRSLEEVSLNFHPQHGVQEKTYWYHVLPQRHPLPFMRSYAYAFSDPIDMKKLQEALSVFVGTHDFRSFCSGWDMEHTIRTITQVDVIYIRKYNCYRIVIKGPGFLRYMIRRIVGACLVVASNADMSIDVLVKALAQKDPEQTLPKAPAHGLVLRKIRYHIPEG